MFGRKQKPDDITQGYLQEAWQGIHSALERAERNPSPALRYTAYLAIADICRAEKLTQAEKCTYDRRAQKEIAARKHLYLQGALGGVCGLALLGALNTGIVAPVAAVVAQTLICAAIVPFAFNSVADLFGFRPFGHYAAPQLAELYDDFQAMTNERLNALESEHGMEICTALQENGYAPQPLHESRLNDLFERVAAQRQDNMNFQAGIAQSVQVSKRSLAQHLRSPKTGAV